MNLLDDILGRLNALPEDARQQVAQDAMQATEKMRFIPLPGPQTEAYLSQADVLLYGGQAGGGKALALDTPIPTPRGWTTMGDIKPGDLVFDETGQPCRVMAVTPVMNGRPCYRVTFCDGAEIVADAGHQWLTFTNADRDASMRRTEAFRQRRRDNREKRGTGKRPDLALMNASRVAEYMDPPSGGVRATEEIASTLMVGKRTNHSVPVALPLDTPSVELPVDPYVLGVWLGDGTRSNGGITTADPQVVEEIEGAGYVVRFRASSKYGYGVLGLPAHLRAAGVLHDKHIPASYLRASIEQRMALLQGLMDTDGTANLRGACEFDNCNRTLIDGVAELLRSLGIKATIREGVARLNGKDCGPKYRIKFTTTRPVFRLRRKLERLPTALRGTQRWRFIKSVEPVESVPVRCVEVDSPSHLFLAGADMVPTHNSFLLMGLSSQEHTRSIVFRRESSQTDGLEEAGKQIIGGTARFNGTDKEWTWGDGRALKLAGIKDPGDWIKHAGRERDLIGFDEAGEFLRDQVSSLMAWNRGPVGQRCRVILASNPPRSSDGYWLTEWFAPWLDLNFPNRAEPGELRYAVMIGGSPEWVDGPEDVEVNGEPRKPLSFTFIPAALSDNPFRNTPEYRAKLNSLPEPLRSQLLYGDFSAGGEDGQDQVIPTAWVKEAMARWTPTQPVGVPMCAIGVDVAQGGTDQTVLANRHDGWFGPLQAIPGVQTPGGADVAGVVLARRHDNAKVIVDLGGGWGGDALAHLTANGVDAIGYMGVKVSSQRTRDNQLRFKNVRTEAYWRFREALDPSQRGGSPIALPDDRELLADLTAPTYTTISERGGMAIALEPKDKLVKRIGRSPDKGDAVVMAWFGGPKMADSHQQWKRGRTPNVIIGRAKAMRRS